MTVQDKKLRSIFTGEKRARKNRIRKITLLVIMLLVSLDVVAQEEHHKHEQHRHLKYANMKNPVAMTTQSIAEGAKLYEKHCMACHGES